MYEPELLHKVARQLGSLNARGVYVGGAVLPILLTDPGAPPPRPTDDVDVAVELATFGSMAELTRELMQLGLRPDTSEGAPTCRWLVGGVKLDVVPTDERYMGFSNRWYRPAILTPGIVELEPGLTIRHISAPFFLATKFEAFEGRGRMDFSSSRDLEDIIAVVDGRSQLAGEIAAAPDDLRRHLAHVFRTLGERGEFVRTLAFHLPGDEMSQGRTGVLLERIRAFGELG